MATKKQNTKSTKNKKNSVSSKPKKVVKSSINKKESTPKTSKKSNLKMEPKKTIKTTSSKSKSNKKQSNVELVSYSCVKRYYLQVDLKTKKEKTKRMWIVIGDGHKRYRKFETQVEAIKYFRGLKKFAKMRVQSVNSKKFIKVVYTLLEMEQRGIDLSLIKKSPKPKTKKISEEFDYEDEFSQFDETNNNDESFDESAIDKVISESESLVFVDEEQIKESDKKIDNNDSKKSDKSSNEQKTLLLMLEDNSKKDDTKEDNFADVFETNEIVENDNTSSTTVLVEKIEESNESDPYALTQEYVVEDETSNDLFSLAKEDAVELDSVQESQVIEEEVVAPLMENENSDEINLSITSTNTLLNTLPEEDTNELIQNSTGKTIIYWTVVVLIAIVLAAAVVVAIYFAMTK